MSEVKYIINIMNSKKIGKYNVQTNSFEEIKKEDGIKLSKGIYSELSDSTIKVSGLIESSEGPILFFDKKRFLIQDTDFNFVHINLDDRRGKFSLYLGEKNVIELEYKKPHSDFDVWSKEEDIDIFQWILGFSKSLEMKSKFLRIYTRK